MNKQRIFSYKDLIVWQKAIDLVIEIYTITDKFPKSEMYGLVSQMRRAAVSIPSNIAEGRKRSTRKDFCRFLCNSFGSGAELETQVLISKRLRYGTEAEFAKTERLLEEVMKMLNTMIPKLKATP